MVERLGEMRKREKRERIEKGSRERDYRKRQNDPFIEFFLDPTLELKHQNLVFTSL